MALRQKNTTNCFSTRLVKTGITRKFLTSFAAKRLDKFPVPNADATGTQKIKRSL